MKHSPKSIAKTLVQCAVLGQDSADVIARFLKYTKKYAMEYIIPAIQKELVSLKNREIEKTTAKITVSRDSDKGIVSSEFLESVFSKAPQNIETRTEEDILGGFVVEFQGKSYDASLSNSLSALKKHLLASQ